MQRGDSESHEPDRSSGADERRSPETSAARPNASAPRLDRVQTRNRQFPGAELLAGDDPRAILEKIYPGDPLGMRLRSQKRLIERGFLVPLERVAVRATARVAQAAPDYEGIPTLREWIGLRIDEAARDLIQEERECEGLGVPLPYPLEPHHRFISDLLGLRRDHVRRSCVQFHDLGLPQRRAFFATCVEGKTIARHAAMLDQPDEVVRQHLREALEALSICEPDDGRFEGFDVVD